MWDEYNSNWLCTGLFNMLNTSIRNNYSWPLITSYYHPSVYYHLLIVQDGNDEDAERSLKTIKMGFGALGRLVDGARVQAVCFSIPSVVVSETERSRKNHLIYKSLKGWCDLWNFGSYDHGAVYSVLRLMAADAAHLGHRQKNIIAQDMSGPIDKALNYIWRRKGMKASLPMTGCGIALLSQRDKILAGALNLLHFTMNILGSKLARLITHHVSELDLMEQGDGTEKSEGTLLL